MKYPVYTPDIQRYTTSIQKAIHDGWISSQGEFLSKAQESCKSILQVPYVVLVNNGTSATHLLYKSIKYKYPSITKLYLPNYVFVAVWNCALYEYDSQQIEILQTDAETLNMNVQEDYIMSLEPNSAVVIVHNIGNVVNVPRLKRLRPDIVFVEDCCEAFLEDYEGYKTGTQSLCGAVSFFGNKVITTGEGGLWYTNDKDLYEYIYKSCHHGMTSERYVYDVLGYNYRMTNLQAALLYDQLSDVDRILTNKRRVYNNYVKLFKNTPIQVITTGLWMMVIRTPYTNVLPEIDTRPMFYSISKHQHLQDIRDPKDDVRHSEIRMIPSSPTLTTYDQVWISTMLQQQQLNIVRVQPENIHYLHEFLTHEMPVTFRYFSKRNVEECVSNNTLTIVGTIDNKPVAYGHIDERWIGICILPEYQSKGFGKLILQFLIQYADLERIPLRLSVDNQNIRAYQLYQRNGFSIVRETELVFFMERSIKE